MSYEVGFHPRVKKQLKGLPQNIQKRALKRIQSLEINPRPSGYRKLTSVNPTTYRIKTGNYRILYTVDDENRLVYILAVVHRSDAY